MLETHTRHLLSCQTVAGVPECVQILENIESRHLQQAVITSVRGSNSTMTINGVNTTISQIKPLNSQQDCPNCDCKDCKENCCTNEVNPLVPQNIALSVLLLNIFFPGVGTMLAACRDPNGCNCRCFNHGVWQMLFTVILVGGIWSIVQGFQIYRKSNSHYEGLTSTSQTKKIN